MVLAVISIYFGVSKFFSLELILVVGVVSCFYFFNWKEKKFGCVVLLIVSVLIFGLVLGGVLSVLVIGLRIEIFIILVIFLVLWMVSCFLC